MCKFFIAFLITRMLTTNITQASDSINVQGHEIMTTSQINLDFSLKYGNSAMVKNKTTVIHMNETAYLDYFV